MTRWLGMRYAELIGAATLLTRLPVGRFVTTHPPPASCIWAYPVIGAAIGGASAAVLQAATNLGVAPSVAAILAVTTTILITGALHEDGLADTADGLGGGRTTDQKLAIMRDSRIGTFGAIALLLSLALRIAVLAGARHPAEALILAEMNARAAMLVPIMVLRPARPEGFGGILAHRSLPTAWLGLAIAAGPTLLLAPWACGATLAASAGITAIARRHIAGYTGDILGAAQQVSLCAALLATA